MTGEVDQTNTAVRAFLEGSTAMDIVDPNPVVADDAPNLFPLGDTVVTFTATDASGNQATAQATVTIIDTTPPLVTAPRGITVGGDLTRGVFQTNVAVHSFLKAERAIDIVDPDPVITNDAPDILSLGDTVITFTAVDASGNQATAQATITVLAQEAPTATPMATPLPTIAVQVTEEPTPTATPEPLPTPRPPPTPSPAPAGGGGCTARAGGEERVEASWLLLGLVGPGLALTSLRRWLWRKRS